MHKSVIKFILSFTLTLFFFCFGVTTHAQKAFVFDPKKTAWFAYENGELIASGSASGGANTCRNRHGISRCHTPVGTFRVFSKGSANCKSSIYPLPNGGAPMPYCMFFSKNYAIHGASSVPAGRNASHGCIRVKPGAALWLTRNFIDIGTTVVVKPY